MKTAFKPDANTTVKLVKAFKKGDALLLSGTPTSTTPVATNDVCMVKLNVGPGNPGPAGAPSTSPGIGIEVWLPSPEGYIGRIHNMGGGGWAGDSSGSVTALSSRNAIQAATEGAVVGSTDTGHTGVNGSFAMNPDGSIDSVLWKDFAERGIRELALKTKALATAYYLTHHKFAYWEGCSTGGRQGYKQVQENPSDYDGYLIGAPAVNWSQFILGHTYAAIVTQNDLGGVGITSAQQALVSGSAVSSCDLVNGQHIGRILDPTTCKYDPTKDASALCSGVTIGSITGTNTTAACLSAPQAHAVNKIWYGMTTDGSYVDPAIDNGQQVQLTGNHLAYGAVRGANVSLQGLIPAISIGLHMIPLILQNPWYGSTDFTNATGNGMEGWRTLGYLQFANVLDQAYLLQPYFGNIDTTKTNLTEAKNSGAKILHYHGLADQAIMPANSISYYEKVQAAVGGYANLQSFDRMFLIPGMAHCAGAADVNGVAGPAISSSTLPLPQSGQLYQNLVNWVEKKTAPTSITLTSTDGSNSMPVCMYPTKITYNGTGDVKVASSYSCKL